MYAFLLVVGKGLYLSRIPGQTGWIAESRLFFLHRQVETVHVQKPCRVSEKVLADAGQGTVLHKDPMHSDAAGSRQYLLATTRQCRRIAPRMQPRLVLWSGPPCRR